MDTSRDAIGGDSQRERARREGPRSGYVTVRGEPMHYLEAGSGSPVLFLHGNPTSSYLWRDVIPHVTPAGRCLAPDLIGMGRSGKPPISYRLRDHVAFIDGFIEALGLTEIAFVMHDWGVAIGLHYLARFPERVRAVAWMEGRLHPVARWADFDEGGRALFQQLRSAETGRRLVIDENIFIEAILQAGVRRTLSAAELDAYRAPYIEPADREPLWRWAQEIPIEGEPADVVEVVEGYRRALTASPIPKLLFTASPGAVVTEADVAWCRSHLANLTVVPLGEGIHFLPEDHPERIGAALTDWLGGIDAVPDPA